MSEPPVPPAGPPAERDWPIQAADTVVDVVDRVREKTTANAVVAARAVVFGLVVGVMALIGVILLVIGVVRATQVGLEALVELFGGDLSHERAVWISYLLVGAVFMIMGSVLWRTANRRARRLDGEERAG